MKICELKINNPQDASIVMDILNTYDYHAWVKVGYHGTNPEPEFSVIVESKEETPDE